MPNGTKTPKVQGRKENVFLHVRDTIELWTTQQPIVKCNFVTNDTSHISKSNLL